MQILSAKETKALDAWATEKLGIPACALMESAGKSAAQIIHQKYPGIKSAVILCYKGNNGGDGAVVARYLNNYGIEVTVLLCTKLKDLKNGAKTNFEVLFASNIKVLENIKSKAKIKSIIKESDLIVDALLGIGLKGKIVSPLKDIIKLVNQSGKTIISLDIPSGLDADTGEALGIAVQADTTITFAYPKKGFFASNALNYIGKLEIADIGIPKEISSHWIEKKLTKNNLHYIDADWVKNHLPRRLCNSHKGSCGKVFIVAGSSGMSGAAMLSSLSALRSGSGLAYLFCPEVISNYVDVAIKEVIVFGCPSYQNKFLSSEAYTEIMRQYLIKPCQALAIGPGLSVNAETTKLVKRILEAEWKAPIIMDADALKIIAQSENREWIAKNKNKIILTPHPGELSAMLKVPVGDIQKNRTKYALQAAKTFNAFVVLKGAFSLVADPKGNYFINPTGNPAMATAGMGDVLTGMIASFIGQGLPILDSLKIAVFVHGFAGDTLAQVKGEQGLLASDIMDILPQTIHFIKRGNYA